MFSKRKIIIREYNPLSHNHRIPISIFITYPSPKVHTFIERAAADIRLQAFAYND